ncbi:adenosine receptor A3-like isoform X5 [Ochotona curzoniae]|uniref:adenosine receptor A3-like isoform X5 n=1 Tax=Ochotona curzoniae TaxID=130825 RepID=UPI001B34EAAD|nr:adenosine receptor A3-like isoform X5 [Ochotona curzoniae]
MSNNGTTLIFIKIAYIIVEILIGLCAVVGNLLVIWVVKINPSMKTTTFYFIVSLALADMAVGLLVMPLAIVVSLGITIRFDSCLFICCLLLIFTQASIMSLLAIAVDRWLRVKLTVRYRRVITQGKIWLALSLCWLLSFLVGLIPVFGWNMKLSPDYSSNGTAFTCTFTSVISMDYMFYFNFLICVFIPLLVMCAIYINIFCIIRNKLCQNSSSSKEMGAFYGREFKTAMSLFLVLFLFAVFWLPLSIINSVTYFNSAVPDFVLYICILLSHSNSMMNPIIYACKIQKFKESYLLILKSWVTCQSSDPLDPNIMQNSK